MKTKTKSNLTKEELLKELSLIKVHEHEEMIKTHYPKFKKMEGKFYKKKNSYGGDKPSQSWWLYTRIDTITEDDVYSTSSDLVSSRFAGLQFQVDRDKHVYIEPIKSGYVHLLGVEISEKEYIESWNKMIDHINSF